MDIKLNFINASNDRNNSDIVIFAKNDAMDSEEMAVAWTVIQYCGQGDNHPFTYPTSTQIAYSDSWGNYTPQLDAVPGERFEAVRTPSGDTIIRSTQPATASTQIELVNSLPQGAVTALIFKAARLFAQVTGVAPLQKAVFEFKPTIWIGVVSQIEQGDVMNSAILSDIDTEISLLGIASADIVMTGGGSGPAATPLVFTLQNIVMA